MLLTITHSRSGLLLSVSSLEQCQSQLVNDVIRVSSERHVPVRPDTSLTSSATSKPTEVQGVSNIGVGVIVMLAVIGACVVLGDIVTVMATKMPKSKQ